MGWSRIRNSTVYTFVSGYGSGINHAGSATVHLRTSILHPSYKLRVYKPGFVNTQAWSLLVSSEFPGKHLIWSWDTNSALYFIRTSIHRADEKRT